ncbi:MAG: alpha-L-fucosidase [Clostridia bacterium]|nr:alpha-L-fucosidase [Clostridia bacterium]
MKKRVEWFKEAGYGIFCHWTTYSQPKDGEKKEHAQAILDFDVKGFTQQIIDTGARFLFFTISHADMYLPFPLKELDEIVPGHTSTRDLIEEMYEILSKNGIRLMLYFNGEGSTDEAYQIATGFKEDPLTHAEYCYRITEAISKKYGKKIHGWWIDCCYEPGICGGRGLRYDYKRYAQALRSGNPDSIVAFNFRGVEPWGSEWGRDIADFQAGEENDLSFLPTSQFSGEGGLQWFGLCWMDDYWVHEKRGEAVPVHSNEKVLSYINEVIKNDGVFAYNVAPYQEGLISEKTMEQLLWLKSRIKLPNGKKG